MDENYISFSLPQDSPLGLYLCTVMMSSCSLVFTDSDMLLSVSPALPNKTHGLAHGILRFSRMKYLSCLPAKPHSFCPGILIIRGLASEL